ncbi:MAG: hypothetical protein PHP00_06800 [Thiotrichaceae bacterium]|nr:hypothetical protein [Thiotrichaceae bacterium]
MSLSAYALAIYQQLITDLRTAKHGGKGQLIQQAIDTLGLSRNQVYRDLEELGYKTERKVRADKGKCVVPDSEVIAIANLMEQSKRQNGKRLLTFEKAKGIAMANGLLSADITAGRLADVMRDIGVHPSQLAQPRGYVPMRTEHPNQVWQIDASTCVIYYLKNGAMQVMDERKFNSKKPQNLAKISDSRVTRYIVTDHYSGAFFLTYVNGTESSSNFFNVFMDSMIQRDNKPFFGVPFCLYFDAASAHQANTSKSLLEWLGVDYRHHLPGNAQATGSVEGLQNIVERNFESVLYMRPVQSLAQLNAAARAFQVAFQSDKNLNMHSRHGHTRYAMWSTIAPQQLRICPPLEKCQQVLRSKPEQRVVTPKLSIGYEGNQYSVRDIAAVRIGEYVTVATNPYRDDCVIVTLAGRDGLETHHECPLIKLDIAGFEIGAPVLFKEHKSAPDTSAEKVKKVMRKAAYGTESIIEADKRRLQKAPAFTDINPFADIEQANIPDHLPRRGVALNTPDMRVELPKLNEVQIRMALLDVLGRSVTKDEMDFINRQYPSVTAADMEEIVSKLTTRSRLNVVKASNG